jgi:type 1 glutamine amidotransferase
MLKPYPQTWARTQGTGRVFYTSMGHREEVWKSPIFEKVVLGGLAWVTGTIDADVKPNLKEAAPGAEELLRKN